jgi:maleylacetoacetate isomerase
MMDQPSDPILHTYFRSSCSARVRTACHLKGISLSYKYINLLQGEQFSSDYKDTNPSATVPTLTIPASSPLNSTKSPIVIRQPVAILEFLEEFPAYGDKPKLLPGDSVDRSKVRELVNIICDDVQPITNQHILKRVDALNADKILWAKELMSRGFTAYEELLKLYAGKYSFGDEVTMADVCLAPAVEGALRWGVDLGAFPHLSRVYNEIRVLDSFVNGDWKHQEDTPEQFRSQ